MANKKWRSDLVFTVAAAWAARTAEGPFAAIPEGVEAGMVVADTTADAIVVVAVRGLVHTTRSVMW